MRAIGVNPGLTHRLLVTTARLHTAGQDQCDWPVIAAATSGADNSAAVQRALAGLAEDGLVEGVCTSSGWLRINITAQGLRRAGRAGRQPLPDTRYWITDAVPVSLAAEPASPEPSSAVAVAVVERNVVDPDASMPDADLLDAEPDQPPTPRPNPLEPLAAGVRDAWRGTREWFAPRIAAVRTQVSEAWRLLTTFP